MTQASPQEMAAPEFRAIDDLVRSVNTRELTGAEILGAFYTSSSFTKNYSIYYQQKGQIAVY